MGARLIFSQIREIQILCDKHPVFGNRRFEHNAIIFPGKPFKWNCVNIVSFGHEQINQLAGEIFIQLDLHARDGSSGTGKSSCADAAA